MMMVMFFVDVFSNRKMLEMILKRKGFHCALCNDGTEAVELVKTVHGLDYYDIIFMDNLMPNMVRQSFFSKSSDSS